MIVSVIWSLCMCNIFLCTHSLDDLFSCELAICVCECLWEGAWAWGGAHVCERNHWLNLISAHLEALSWECFSPEKTRLFLWCEAGVAYRAGPLQPASRIFPWMCSSQSAAPHWLVASHWSPELVLTLAFATRTQCCLCVCRFSCLGYRRESLLTAVT